MYKANSTDMENLFKEALALWSHKNEQYGGTCDRLHEQFGDVYFDIMLQQKLNRIIELGTTEAVYESKLDSIMDLINYSAMYYTRLQHMDDDKTMVADSLPVQTPHEKYLKLCSYYFGTDWTDRHVEETLVYELIETLDRLLYATDSDVCTELNAKIDYLEAKLGINK